MSEMRTMATATTMCTTYLLGCGCTTWKTRGGSTAPRKMKNPSVAIIGKHKIPTIWMPRMTIPPLTRKKMIITMGEEMSLRIRDLLKRNKISWPSMEEMMAATTTARNVGRFICLKSMGLNLSQSTAYGGMNWPWGTTKIGWLRRGWVEALQMRELIIWGIECGWGVHQGGRLQCRHHHHFPHPLWSWHWLICPHQQPIIKDLQIDKSLVFG